MDARGARSQNPGMKSLSGQAREWSKKQRKMVNIIILKKEKSSSAHSCKRRLLRSSLRHSRNIVSHVSFDGMQPLERPLWNKIFDDACCEQDPAMDRHQICHQRLRRAYNKSCIGF
ncbi:hypothetical protein AVEN_146086-1 [Araneus ventricosus]|uniref:Uncharacterized protein n=1 Tax=Araneus ventricosus TaxID=182803 RepID=A0A4Y2GMF1_ARAVE|nr:hypothetical protein AVEN_146086-1 [Araneus ventricosus]